MNLSAKTLKVIATLLIVLQVIAFIYMVKSTWRNDEERSGTFFLVIILPLFSMMVFRMAKKKSEAEK